MKQRSLWSSLALAGAIAFGGQVANAQTIDFLSTDGGFTQTNLSGANVPWTYTGGLGWSVGQSSNVGHQRLFSDVYTATGTSFGMLLSHSFDFEGNCFDGGQVRVSVNGGAFNLLTPSAGYTNTVSAAFGSPIGGQSAFCGQSGSILSTFSSNVGVNDQIQFAFDAAWDSSVLRPAPNWLLTSMELRGLSSSTVPEPSTVGLMVAGLAFGVLVRRKRAA